MVLFPPDKYPEMELLECMVHGVLKAIILKRFAIPFSSLKELMLLNSGVGGDS